VEDQASGLRNITVSDKEAARLPGRLRCIAVGSGKGGVGKTMLSVGLSTSLARMNHKVLVLDADVGLANVDLQMGIDPTYTLQDVIFGSCRMEDAVIHVENGLSVLAAAAGSPELVDMGDARRQMFVSELIRFASQYDFLVIDSSAGIGRGVTTFLSAAPEVLVVVANEPTSLMDAYSLIKVLRQNPNPPEIMMVVNMVKSLDEGELLASRLNGITKRFLGVDIPVAGIIVHDSVVGDAIRARKSIVNYASKSGPSQCLQELAQFIAAGECYARARGRLQKPFFDRLAEIGMNPEGLKKE
jgi:flagellar biosynthesis protein FlhG